MLREYGDLKEEIKNLKTFTVHQIFQSVNKTMLYFCLTYRKAESKNKTVSETSKGKPILSSKCAVFDSKKIEI